MRKCHDAVICDFAETYRIYDIRNFDIEYIATLAAGLTENSRVWMGFSDSQVSTMEILLSKISDELTIIRWFLTASKGQKKPELILENIQKQKSKQDEHRKYKLFSSPEEFEKVWKAGIK